MNERWNIRDIELAKEEAENGEGTEDDKEDVGEKREKGGVAEGAVVVNCYRSNRRT